MPSLFQIGSYKVFFWSNENNEPIHVHIAKSRPSPDSTKVWITAKGGCLLANNTGRIPGQELNEMFEIISAHFFIICRAWKEHFLVDTIQFYC